jgi:hypothetical protein
MGERERARRNLITKKEKIITIMRRKKNKKEKKEKCKIENVNNFTSHLKIEMIIIIFHRMYYIDFYYISSNVLF